jgi:prolyl oligopeptidase
VDTCFGNRVPDPYRWLEHNRATDTKDWVQAENQLTERYFSQILFRGALRQCLTSILNYERYSVPHQEGQNTYFSKNTGL